MTQRMIALIGEQPMPNLLPLKFEPPEAVLLVRTKRTRPTSERLAKALQNQVAVCFCHIADPYDISAIYEKLTAKIDGLGWGNDQVIFNLTGGTKTMVLAAYQLAMERAAEFIYLESEGGRSRLRRYAFEDRLALLKQDMIIPAVITLADYLDVHLAAYQSKEIKEPFEQLVFETLQPEVDEIKAAVQDPTGTLDIDIVVRLGNQVGIVEAKTGHKAKRKEGIDQVNTAGGRAFLGTYTKKFLVVDASWERLTNLRTLAKDRNVVVIELPNYGETKQLSESDKQQLIQKIKTTLGE